MWTLGAVFTGLWIASPPQLDAVGEELAVFPIDHSQGDTKEGREEVHAYCRLQRRKE